MAKLARRVALIGAGMSKFGAWFPQKVNRDLWQDAVIEAIKSVDKGINMKDIDELYLGNFTADLFNHESHLAPLMAQIAGMNPKPATRFESACASSGLALRHGIIGVASGINDLVMVGGVECMTQLPTANVTDALSLASDSLLEGVAGATFPALYASVANVCMNQYGIKDEDLFNIAIKNYENGKENPFAQVQSTIAEVMEEKKNKALKSGQPAPDWKNSYDFLRSSSNPMIAYPLRLFDCSLVTDGAACVFLASEKVAKKYTDSPIWITGTGQGSDSLSLADRTSFTSFNAARVAAQTAYKMAGVEPKQIKIAEVHDCFTIAELVALQDLGFYPTVKEAAAGIAAGDTKRNGLRPINTSGGLKTKGHPVGATGAAQAVEVFKQMRGKAERNRQVKGEIDKALTHNLGGSGATCVVTIYEK
jgi:acetyl-CoA C-acetyltransferase